MRLATVLIVVLHDQTAIGGLAEGFAVVATGTGFIHGFAVGVEVVGFACGSGVINGCFRRFFGAQDVIRQARSEAGRNRCFGHRGRRCLRGGEGRSVRANGKADGGGEDGAELWHG